jgi:hypothetical protein
MQDGEARHQGDDRSNDEMEGRQNSQILEILIHDPLLTDSKHCPGPPNGIELSGAASQPHQLWRLAPIQATPRRPSQILVVFQGSSEVLGSDDLVQAVNKNVHNLGR